MMFRPMRIAFAASLVLGSALLLGAASPADQVKARVNGLKELGAALKNVNDALRAPAVDKVTLRYSVRQIKGFAATQYRWFPKGSGPQPGLKTDAKAEIWTNPAGFKKAQDAFAAEAAALDQAMASGNLDAVRAQARKVGGSCKGCHDSFRVEQKH